VLLIGYAVGIGSRSLSMDSEILSRTSPSLLDLLIALVGGMAGGFTYVSKGLTGVIVGVAIATALVPPLTSCGILLAHHLPGLAAGALLLFFANFTAIAIGAMLVFWLSGHRPRAASQAQRVLVPRLISLVLLAALGVNFSVTFRRTVARSLLENNVRKTVSLGVEVIPGARVVSVRIASGRGAPVAWAVVRVPQPVSTEQVARLNDLVNGATGTTVALHVRSVITAETTREGYLHKPDCLPTEDPTTP
jgi:uncharacterized membrane protein